MVNFFVLIFTPTPSLKRGWCFKALVYWNSRQNWNFQTNAEGAVGVREVNFFTISLIYLLDPLIIMDKSTFESRNLNSDFFNYLTGTSKPSQIPLTYFLITSLGFSSNVWGENTYFCVMLIIKRNNANFCIYGFSIFLRHFFFSTQGAEIFMQFFSNEVELFMQFFFLMKWNHSARWLVKISKLQK